MPISGYEFGSQFTTSMTTFKPAVPAEVVFAPDWWYAHYGVAFDEPFYFDRETRIENDVIMRRALYEHFGLGEANPRRRPIIGSMHVAGGFVAAALLGIEIRFAKDAAPWPVTQNLSREQVLALRPPDILTTWPMNQLIADMDALEGEFGYVLGDLNTEGLLDNALSLRGQAFFLDLVEDPELVQHLLAVVSETQLLVAELLRQRTGTTSISANRGIVHVDPRIYLHPNCSVQMISPATYDRCLFRYEEQLAERLPPYGIHHCGNNLHRFAGIYGRLPLAFVDVGYGSDVRRCRELLPQAFLNLRLSPVRMVQQGAEEIRREALELLSQAYPGPAGLCCINMDAATPDENVLALLDAARAGYPPDLSRTAR
jgi:hypothetical protein